MGAGAMRDAVALHRKGGMLVLQRRLRSVAVHCASQHAGR